MAQRTNAARRARWRTTSSTSGATTPPSSRPPRPNSANEKPVATTRHQRFSSELRAGVAIAPSSIAAPRAAAAIDLLGQARRVGQAEPERLQAGRQLRVQRLVA